MVRVTRPGDPVTVGLTRLGQARVLEERPTVATRGCAHDKASDSHALGSKISPTQLPALPESKPSHAHAIRVVVLPVMRLEVSNALRFGQPDETIPAAGGKDPRPQPFAMACWCRAAKAGKLAPTVLARAEGCVSEAFHRLGTSAEAPVRLATPALCGAHSHAARSLGASHAPVSPPPTPPRE